MALGGITIGMGTAVLLMAAGRTRLKSIRSQRPAEEKLRLAEAQMAFLDYRTEVMINELQTTLGFPTNVGLSQQLKQVNDARRNPVDASQNVYLSALQSLLMTRYKQATITYEDAIRAQTGQTIPALPIEQLNLYGSPAAQAQANLAHIETWKPMRDSSALPQVPCAPNGRGRNARTG